MGKIPATFSDIFSLILGLIAILATIVFSRLSTDIREAKERLQELVTWNQENADQLNERLATTAKSIQESTATCHSQCAATIQTEMQKLRAAIETLNRSTEIERMLKAMAEDSVPHQGAQAPDKTPTAPEESITPTLQMEADELRAEMSFEETEVLHIFAEANESALSYDLFERYVAHKDVPPSILRESLDKLRTRGCLTVYSTALALTALGRAAVQAIERGGKLPDEGTTVTGPDRKEPRDK
jgi:type II secretory pathway pseudopilin PulG